MPQETPWISVGELAQAFEPDSNILPRTRDLAGKTLTLHFEDGSVTEYVFDTDQTLSWRTAVPGGGGGEGAEEEYLASRIREGIYFVDHLRNRERATSVSLVLDLRLGAVTALTGRLPTEDEARKPLVERVGQGKELTGVAVAFRSGAVDRPFTAATPRHAVTDELVGRRVEYTYSATERYEHIYLNEDFYCWHCLCGSEKGLADTDRCHYLKLAPQLYLFVWREKIIPTLGVVVVDFGALKTTGKILGYRNGGFQELANFPVGAHARVLNVTPRGEP